MSTQPEALRLAYALEHCLEVGGSSSDAIGLTDRSQATVDSAAAELRRLHALNGELLDALRGLDGAYCRAGTPITRDERHEDRMRLIAARAAIAKATSN